MDDKKIKEEQEQLYTLLKGEATQVGEAEPILKCLLSRTILHPEAKTFNDIIAITIAHRLSSLTNSSTSEPDVCPNSIRRMLSSALESSELELGHTMAEAVRLDALSCVRRDPACESVMEVILYFKGFAALVCHRAARRRWKKRLNSSTIKFSRYAALWLQSQASAAFGVDIHPAAQIGSAVMFDHGTGIVVGETAVIGDGCTLLHGVTLGGTGKESGDRHPKIGKDVLIGAGASVLGNIIVGDGAKIGSGAIVLKPIPQGSTAVGAPARIIGWAKEKRPGSSVDIAMLDVSLKQAKNSTSLGYKTTSTASTEDLTVETRSSDGVDVEEFKSVSLDASDSDEEDFFCPFKDIVKYNASKGNSICEQVQVRYLFSLMKKENCSDSECGEVFCALLKDCPDQINCGKFFQGKFTEIAMKHTSLDEEKSKRIADKLFAQYKNKDTL